MKPSNPPVAGHQPAKVPTGSAHAVSGTASGRSSWGGGGYFAARPDAPVLNPLASAFLALSRADPFDLHAALRGLFREVARAAANSASAALQVELAEALEALRETGEASIPAGLAAATEVTAIFLQMAENVGCLRWRAPAERWLRPFGQADAPVAPSASGACPTQPRQ